MNKQNERPSAGPLLPKEPESITPVDASERAAGCMSVLVLAVVVAAVAWRFIPDGFRIWAVFLITRTRASSALGLRSNEHNTEHLFLSSGENAIMPFKMSQPADVEIMEPRHWKKSGWNARVIKNEEDDGWAVEMTRLGDAEPALVSPWTMGRDKKNPVPMDQGRFTTMVKTASEVIMRHEQQARAKLHRQLRYNSDDGVSMVADFDIVPDDDDPHAMLTVRIEATGEEVRSARVAANAKLNAVNVQRFVTLGELR